MSGLVTGQLAALQLDSSGFGPLVLAAIAAGAVLVALAYTRGLRGRGRSGRGKSLLLLLRLGSIACLLAALLHPVWVWKTAELERPTLAIVLDDSLSMSQHAGGEGDSVTRYAKALEVLRSKLQPKFANRFELLLYDVEGRRLAPQAVPPEAKARRSPLSATLVRVQRALRAKDLKGIVLLSDGNESVERAGASGGVEEVTVPVYPVDLARRASAETGPPDVAIQAVIANRRTLVGNAVRVRTLLTAQGAMTDRTLEVTVVAETVPVARKLLRWQAGQTDRSAEVEFVPRRAGRYTYTVEVRQVGLGAASQPGGAELNLANNRATFPLTVRAKPLTVLYIDGVLRWEGKFMREALATDPDVNVVTAIRTVARAAGAKSQGLLTKEQLANVDVVILGDVEPEFFAEAELSSLKTWVTDDGGGLLLTGGYLCFARGGFGSSILRQVLPVVFIEDGPTQIDAPFNLKLTEIGQAHPIFHVTGDRAKDRAIWHSLPALSGCSRIRSIKPGAQVLAVNPTVGGLDDAGGLPVMVVQEVGLGRTMVFAVDTTWKWRTIVGGFTGNIGFYQKFWGQTVRFLATGEDDTAAARLFVSTDRYRYTKGQDIQVAVELKPPGRGGSATRPSLIRQVDYRVRAHAIDEEGRRVRLPLTAAGPDRYQATLPAARTGRMDVLVVAEPILPEAMKDDDEHIVHSQVVTVQVDRPDLELLRPRPDPQWLARVAQVSGGRFLKLEDVDSWQMEADPTSGWTVKTMGLWHHPVLITVFFALLCTEWVLRRLRRLA